VYGCGAHRALEVLRRDVADRAFKLNLFGYSIPEDHASWWLWRLLILGLWILGLVKDYRPEV
jgi:hypothetical protein